MLQYHKRSLRNALLDLFPDIGLDRTKLTRISCPPLSLSHLPAPSCTSFFNLFVASWQDPSTRRKFFEDIAHLNGFDPLKAENWYQQLSSLVLSIKVFFVSVLLFFLFFLKLFIVLGRSQSGEISSEFTQSAS